MLTAKKAGNSAVPIHDEIMRCELERRELRITGAIDSETAHLLQVKLAYLLDKSKRAVTIYVNTPGGSIIDGLAIYDAIMAARAKGVTVRIVAQGACMSMGAIIMQAATERCAAPHSSFLLHELSMLNIGSLGQLRDRHNDAERLQEVLNSIIMERTGLSASKLKELVERRDLYLSAEDAKKYRLIDKVLG